MNGGIILQDTEVTLFQQKGIYLVLNLAAYLPVALPVFKEAWKELARGKYSN